MFRGPQAKFDGCLGDFAKEIKTPARLKKAASRTPYLTDI